MSEAVNAEWVLKMVERHGVQRGGLISLLDQIQKEYGYLPEKALLAVSAKTGRALRDIYSVATFYRSFSLEPRGKHLVCACLGTACHVRGAQRVVEELERKLGLKAGQTTPDKEFSLETVNCLGACALGPVVVTDGRYHSKVKKSAVSELLEKAARGNGSAEAGMDESCFPLNVACPHCGQALKDDTQPLDDYPSIPLDGALGRRRGWVRLSSLYGSSRVATEFPIPKGAVVAFRCSQCRSRLPRPSDCWECGAPMATLRVVGGGTVSFCCRRGCTNHQLEVT